MTRRVPSAERLDRLIEEATVDCYSDAEQAVGLFTMIEDNVAFPFTTEILGLAAVVAGVDMSGDDRIVALCGRGRHRQRVDLADLRLPEPPPRGAEWIAAYRRWSRARG